MKKNITKSRKIPCSYTLLLTAIFIFILALTCLTPLIADDYSYCFSFATGERITSVAEIPMSMAEHRISVNGRVLAHFLVQLMLLLPKPVFNIANGLVAALMAFTAAKYFFAEGKAFDNSVISICGVFAVWLFVPQFGQVFLWLDGTVNYSWAIAATLLFVLPFYRKLMGKPCIETKTLKILFAVFCCAAGAYSESFSAAAIFIAGCLFLAACVREKKLDTYYLICLVTAFAGYVLLMTAPSELGGRSGEFSISAVARSIKYILQTTGDELGGLYCVFFTLLGLAVMDVFAEKKNRDWIGLFSAAVFFLGGLASIAMFSFAVYYPPRAMLASAVWTILACLVLLSGMVSRRRALVFAMTGLCIGMSIFPMLLGVMDIAVGYKAGIERERVIAEALAAGADEVVIEAYKPETKYSAASGLEDISTETNMWPNDSIANYYGIKYVTGTR